MFLKERTKRYIQIVGGVAAGMIVIGAFYEYKNYNEDRERFMQAGKYIDELIATGQI